MQYATFGSDKDDSDDESILRREITRMYVQIVTGFEIQLTEKIKYMRRGAVALNGSKLSVLPKHKKKLIAKEEFVILERKIS